MPWERRVGVAGVWVVGEQRKPLTIRLLLTALFGKNRDDGPSANWIRVPIPT